MKQAFSIVLVLLAGLSLNSCKEAGCTDPVAVNYLASAEEDDGSCVYLDPQPMLRFDATINGQPFELNKDLTLADGRRIHVDAFYFYLSNFRFGNSAYLAPRLVHLYRPGSNGSVLGEIPEGQYSKVVFNLGLEPMVNHQDPTQASGVLNDAAMHWGWNPSAGYKFVRVEGKADTSANNMGAIDAPFEFHIATDAMLRPVQLIGNIRIDPGSDVYLALDVDEFFKKVDFKTEFDVHGGGPLGTKLMANLESALSLKP